jgi:signal transduction histidine kinase
MLAELAVGEQLRYSMFERFMLAVYDEHGALIASSWSPALAPTAQNRAKALGQTTPVLGRRRVSEAEAEESAPTMYRTALQSFAAGDGQRYLLLTASSDQYAQELIQRVTHALAIATPIGIVAAAAAGWAIAGIAITPLRELRSIAQRLSPESIGQRVEVSAHDVEITRLERDLESARERIAQALRAHERFMSNVSHELKTPIAVVLTEAQAISLGDASPDVREFVESVQEEMHRLGRLVDSFLMLTRVREGRDQTVARRCMVNDLLLESIDHCRAMARQYGVALRLRLLEDESDVDLQIRGDPELLRTMLDNLVRNAIRFSPGGANVAVDAARENAHVNIRVTDDGPGIPEPMLARVFDRFAQAPSEERRGRGHGLGLEIAQGVAELHGGHITARNRVEGGCEFIIMLPASEPTPIRRA